MQKTKIVLIVATALLLGGVFVYFFMLAQEKNSPSSTVPIQVTPTPRVENSQSKKSEWELYSNKKANFSIQYPKEWGPVKTEMFTMAISEIGENFYVVFSNNNFHISGNTENYVPWEGWNPGEFYKGTDPFLYCKEIEKRVISLGSCQSVDANKAVITFGYYDDIGGLWLAREAFVRNPGNKYSGVTITYRFDNEGVDSGMGNMNEDQIRRVIEDQLKKINQDTVATFDAVVSSFSSPTGI